MEGFSKDIFADLNILHDPTNPAMTAKLVKFAVELGYDTVAINHEAFDLMEEVPPPQAEGGGGKRRKKAARKIVDIPEPFMVRLTDADIAKLSVKGKKFRIYSRLSIALDDVSLLHKIIRHPSISKYDILAVYPKNEQAFSTVVNKMDADIIGIDLNSKTRWVSKGKTAQMAVKKGIAFEISYSTALTDSSVRRDMFANARSIVE
ncbi:unnamed protein product [Soboliphyme baturini]|uniref:Ribonuclease P protein component 3 n=1 Tax=Soboliphyme baturini TaxID=241478 RepID=A0A183IXV9_9BILA|nr:unnamed protein product [Soboliphyme baturini]